MARIAGLSASLFTLGGTEFITALEEATLSMETKTKEGKAVSDYWDDPEIVGGSWKVECTIDVATAATLMPVAAAKAPVALVANSGANTYSGNVVISPSHKWGRDDLQSQKVTMMGKGALTITPPGGGS